MKKTKLQKGMYGFLSKKKRMEIVKTVVLFAVALAVFFLGWMHTKTKQNMLSIVAVLGMLPASKSAVNMIMFLRYKPAEESLAGQLRAFEENAWLLYDLIFVFQEKLIKTDCIFVHNMEICVYTQHKKMTEQALVKQFKNFLSNHGKGNYAVHVVKSEEKFVKQVKKRMLDDEKGERNKEQEDKIKDMLFGFSL